MLFPAEQASVGRDEKRPPPKAPAWEAKATYAHRLIPRIYLTLHSQVIFIMLLTGPGQTGVASKDVLSNPYDGYSWSFLVT